MPVGTERPTPPTTLTRKRSHNFQDDDGSAGNETDDDDDLDLESLGYMAGPLLASLTMDNKVWDMRRSSQDSTDGDAD